MVRVGRRTFSCTWDILILCIRISLVLFSLIYLSAYLSHSIKYIRGSALDSTTWCSHPHMLYHFLYNGLFIIISPTKSRNHARCHNIHNLFLKKRFKYISFFLLRYKKGKSHHTCNRCDRLHVAVLVDSNSGLLVPKKCQSMTAKSSPREHKFYFFSLRIVSVTPSKK